MQNDAQQLAEGMFEAYGQDCGWKTFDGRDMPHWDGVNDAVRAHWVAVVEFVVTTLLPKE